MGNVRIARLFGIPIELNVSWFLIFFLVAWSLSAEIFPNAQPGLTASAYWGLGIVTALVLFASLLAHELAHSLVSRRFGSEVKRITLFLFGGVSESSTEMPSPKAEFWIAIVGPITSFVLGGLFLLLALPTHGVFAVACSWLGIINLGLGVFNLIPGYPLDGGRVLRAIIWGGTHDMKKATRWAAGVGEAFAVVLIGIGLARLFGGEWFGGFWLIFLGWLLFQAARSSYSQLVLKQALAHVPVRELMTKDVVTLSPDLTLRDAVDRFFLHLQYGAYPVMDGDRLVGMLTRQQVRELPSEAWSTHRVGEVMVPAAQLPTVTPDQDVGALLEPLMAEGYGRVPVTENGRLVGLLSQTDVLRYLSWQRSSGEKSLWG